MGKCRILLWADRGIFIGDHESKELPIGDDIKEQNTNIIEPVEPPKDVLVNNKKDFTITEYY